MTSNDNCVSSGNYPSSYSNYESCTITPLGNGLLSVVSFSTEGYYDTLSIDIDGDGANDATYSGYYPPPLSTVLDFPVLRARPAPASVGVDLIGFWRVGT